MLGNDYKWMAICDFCTVEERNNGIRIGNKFDHVYL